MNKDLKPCPFCGDTVKAKKGFQGITFFVCDKCGAVVSFAGKASKEVENPIKSYNSRYDK